MAQRLKSTLVFCDFVNITLLIWFPVNQLSPKSSHLKIT